MNPKPAEIESHLPWDPRRRGISLQKASLRFALGIVAILGSFILCSVAVAEPVVDTRDPYLAASQDTGVPLALLAAIAGAESAYHPWALNESGQQIYCHSRAEAETIMTAVNSEDVDIGLMQINYRLWGRRLGLTREQLLDPRINLLAGAR